MEPRVNRRKKEARREWRRGMNVRAESYQRRVEEKSGRAQRYGGGAGFATSFELPGRTVAGGQKVQKKRMAESEQSLIREQHRKISAVQESAPSRLENVAYVDKIEMVLLGACASWTLSSFWRRISFVGVVGLLYLFNRLSAGSRSFFLSPERFKGLYGALASFTWAVIAFHVKGGNFFLQSFVASAAFFFSYTLRLQLKQHGSLKGFWLSIQTGEAFKHMAGAGQPIVRYAKAD